MIPGPVYATVGETITVSFSPAPTKTSKVFKGWATSSSAGTATYTASGTKTFTAATDVTLYAVYANS